MWKVDETAVTKHRSCAMSPSSLGWTIRLGRVDGGCGMLRSQTAQMAVLGSDLERWAQSPDTLIHSMMAASRAVLVAQSASQSRLWSVLRAQEDGNLHPHITKAQPCFASSHQKRPKGRWLTW